MPGVTEVTNEDWRQNTLSLLMCGGSGAGKTTTARALHETFEGPSVFFNLDHEPGFGEVVESVPELADALGRRVDRIDVRPPETVVEEPELFEDVVRFLMSFGTALREVGAGKVQFIMDECHDLQEKWLCVALKRFRKRRIKAVAMTQDPVSLTNRARTVAAYNCWLSPPEDKMAETIRQMGYPVDLLQSLPHYDMLVMGDGWKPLARFRAGEEFALE